SGRPDGGAQPRGRGGGRPRLGTGPTRTARPVSGGPSAPGGRRTRTAGGPRRALPETASTEGCARGDPAHERWGRLGHAHSARGTPRRSRKQVACGYGGGAGAAPPRGAAAPREGRRGAV